MRAFAIGTKAEIRDRFEASLAGVNAAVTTYSELTGLAFEQSSPGEKNLQVIRC